MVLNNDLKSTKEVTKSKREVNNMVLNGKPFQIIRTND